MIHVYLSEYYIDDVMYPSFSYYIPEFGAWFNYTSDAEDTIEESGFYEDPLDWDDPNVQYTYIGKL